MSKLKCQCGNILSDVCQSDSETNFGFFVSNGEWYEYEAILSSPLAGLCKAYKANAHLLWLEKTKNCPVYADQDLQGIISDMISRETLDMGVPYAKCSKCNTLMILKRGEGNIYVPYTPTGTEISDGI